MGRGRDEHARDVVRGVGVGTLGWRGMTRARLRDKRSLRGPKTLGATGPHSHRGRWEGGRERGRGPGLSNRPSPTRLNNMRGATERGRQVQGLGREEGRRRQGPYIYKVIR